MPGLKCSVFGCRRGLVSASLETMSRHFFGHLGSYPPLRVIQILLCMSIGLVGLACSSGSDSAGTSSKGTESSLSTAPPVCDELDAVRRAVEAVQIAVRA